MIWFMESAACLPRSGFVQPAAAANRYMKDLNIEKRHDRSESRKN